MDQRIIDLFDEYTHGGMNRRGFLDRLAGARRRGAAATALLPLLAEQLRPRRRSSPESDPRIAAETVQRSGRRRASRATSCRPKAGGKLPAVIVIHENRGLNPHIKDVTRRVATEASSPSASTT